MFSMSIPDWEIHMSNEPIALIISAGYIKPHKIISKGNYFIINQKRTRGIYTIKGKYRLMWGRTPVYFYAVDETNPIDPKLTNELNNFMKTNHLNELKIQDINHGSRLRILQEIKDKINPLESMDKEETVKLDEMDKNLNDGIKNIQEHEDKVRAQYDKDISLAPVKKSYMLVEHLLRTKQIDEKEYALLLHKIENHELNFTTLINELRDLHVIRVYEPLDINVEAYIGDLGAVNARELAGFVQDLRNNKKGLESMTSKPVQSFLTGGVILAIGIVALLAVVLIPQSLPGLTGGGGINLNPFTMFGGKFIDILVTKLPMMLGSIFHG